MAELPSAQDVATFIDETLRGEIDPNATGAYDNSPGSDNAALISVLTKVAMGVYGYAADRKKASLGQSAEGDDLDVILEDVYFDERQGANAAVTTVYLKRTAGPLAATSIDQGTRFGVPQTSTTPAVTFEATQTVPVPSAQGYVAVPVKCQVEGSVGEVQLSAITQILDTLDDSNWVLYVPIGGDPVLNGKPNPDVVGGGQDQENDDQAKARVLVRPAQAAPGTKAGVYKGATTVPGVASAVPVEPGDGTGLVYAGDQNFLLPSALQQKVKVQLEDWRAFGVAVDVRPMTVVTVLITGTVYMQLDLSNYDLNALLSNAVAGVIAYFQTGRARPDEYFIDRIRGAIGDANQGTQSVVLSSPGVTADQKRPADGSMGAVSAITRYIVSAASIQITFQGPQTL